MRVLNYNQLLWWALLYIPQWFWGQLFIASFTGLFIAIWHMIYDPNPLKFGCKSLSISRITASIDEWVYEWLLYLSMQVASAYNNIQ